MKNSDKIIVKENIHIYVSMAEDSRQHGKFIVNISNFKINADVWVWPPQ
jgi:hypothetical protein